RRLDRGPRAGDLRHLRADLARGAAGLIELAPQRVQLGDLAVDGLGFGVEPVQLSGDLMGLGVELAHQAAGIVEALEAALTVGNRGTEIGDALRHRLDATPLEVET